MDQPTILLLEKRTGVPACLSLQPLRKCASLDARPARSTRVPVATELRRCLVIAPDVRRPRLHCTSSGTELLLRSQHRTSPVHNNPKSRITVMVVARLLTLIVISAALVCPGAPSGMAGGRRPAAHGHGLADCRRVFLRQHGIGRRLWLPRRGLGCSGPAEALLGFALCESNKTGVRRPRDKYGKLNNI
ncbi:hypothetical protein MRX96_014582 [Rhipicephalus microplus]|uniref:Uncharacterized protein n=1 Tax=Rhipicephalus microplus TaxID=6941 RepID=A0A9J6DRJ6_RHIMP|nr:hypothetical protein HPB51_000437 [Rhipicephalus microplus]